MSASPKRVLVVEDEKPIARALELKLNGGGFAATVVPDGVTALETLKSNKFDLILSDLVMPNLDGFGLLQAIKDQKLNTPVIILSNLSQDDDEGRARELGAVNFFIKSDVSISEIIEHVKNILK